MSPLANDSAVPSGLQSYLFCTRDSASLHAGLLSSAPAALVRRWPNQSLFRPGFDQESKVYSRSLQSASQQTDYVIGGDNARKMLVVIHYWQAQQVVFVEHLSYVFFAGSGFAINDLLRI